MGKNKKGKGAEKTAAKTDKKLSKKQKKGLLDLGEDDVEKIVAEIEKEEEKKSAIVEVGVDRPMRRSAFTFVAHPEKDELILFGGEQFNGQKATMFNDILFYNIARGDWTCVKAPKAPGPRSGHQMVAVPGGKGGQLWVFGGEFSSASQSQFYHYKDLYCFHLGEKKWQKIKDTPGGPSARSGHRMVLCKKQMILFGGYNDNARDYKYFNDVYAFDLKEYKWRKIEPTGTAPTPRSGCQMAALASGKVLISGGYSRQRVKKDVDKGIAHVDSFLLTPDKGDETGTKWKWVSVKLGGISPYPRSGISFTMGLSGRCYAFGGVQDEEGEEDLAGTFHNDTYILDLDKTSWKLVSLCIKEGKTKKRRRKEGGEEEDDEGEEEEEEEMETAVAVPETQVTSDDGIFKMTVGPSLETPSNGSSSTVATSAQVRQSFIPRARMNAGLAFKHGKLYLYGGMYEDGDKELTLSDLHCLDVHKLEEWQTLLVTEEPDDWIESDTSEDSDESGSESEEGEEDEEESPMDTD